MSKNFEEEYRQMIDSEIPDLWAQIEERLPEGAPERETPSVNDKSFLPVSFTAFFTRRRTAALITAAAAVVCIFAVSPVFLTPRNGEGMSTESNRQAQSAQKDSLGDMAAFINDRFQSNDSAPQGETNGNYYAAEAMENEDNYDVKPDSFAYSDDAPQEDVNHAGIQSAQDALSESKNLHTDKDMQGEDVGEMFHEPEPAAEEQPSDEDIADARAAAEEYYRGTVFEVLSMEPETMTKEKIVFRVSCNKGGKPVEPDRTVEVTFDGEQWKVTNEGY